MPLRESLELCSCFLAKAPETRVQGPVSSSRHDGDIERPQEMARLRWHDLLRKDSSPPEAGSAPSPGKGHFRQLRQSLWRTLREGNFGGCEPRTSEELSMPSLTRTCGRGPEMQPGNWGRGCAAEKIESSPVKIPRVWILLRASPA